MMTEIGCPGCGQVVCVCVTECFYADFAGYGCSAPSVPGGYYCQYHENSRAMAHIDDRVQILTRCPGCGCIADCVGCGCDVAAGL